MGRAEVESFDGGSRLIVEIEDEAGFDARWTVRLECPDVVASHGFRSGAELTAAKLVVEIAGADRFATDAKLVRAAGLAPIPVSSGNTNRHRLDRGGNRQINAAIHRIAITRARCHPETRAHRDRKRAEGKSTREATAASSATSARRIRHLLQAAPPASG